MTHHTNDADADRTTLSSDTSNEIAPSLLPGDPRTFWSAAVDLDELELPPRHKSEPTLERLVPSPFPRSGFPLIGFLATVYDHVAAFALERDGPGASLSTSRPVC